ncbi:MAG: hypothetical protein JWR15_3456 [Prosthecobacter sp.]|nr:hypothetical protein [Prosthecobacter sp.]
MTEPSPRIVGIVRKHAHDVRNSINILNLEAELLSELSGDPTVSDTLRRMRAELMQLEATVKALQYKFATPAPLLLTAGDLLHFWQRQIAPLERDGRKIAWATPPVAREMTLDAHAMVSVLRELVLAAWDRAAGRVLQGAVIATDDSVVAELREPSPKTPPPEAALEEPQRLVELHGGTLKVGVDETTGERVTTLRFPTQPPKFTK